MITGDLVIEHHQHVWSLIFQTGVFQCLHVNLDGTPCRDVYKPSGEVPSGPPIEGVHATTAAKVKAHLSQKSSPHGYTSHGHKCCDRAEDDPRHRLIAKCGGPAMCRVCGPQANQLHEKRKS